MKVNQQFVDELLKSNKNVKGLIEDDRFKSMFEDKDFARDKNSAEYKAVKPVSSVVVFTFVCRLPQQQTHRTKKTCPSVRVLILSSLGVIRQPKNRSKSSKTK